MPSCNCDQHQATHRFQGPGEVIYALTITNGCDNCGVGVYVQIHRFTSDEAERAGVLDLPEVKFVDLLADFGGRQATFPIWSPRRLTEAFEGLMSRTFARLRDGKGPRTAEKILGMFPTPLEIREIIEAHSKESRRKLL